MKIETPADLISHVFSEVRPCVSQRQDGLSDQLSDIIGALFKVQLDRLANELINKYDQNVVNDGYNDFLTNCQVSFDIPAEIQDSFLYAFSNGLGCYDAADFFGRKR